LLSPGKKFFLADFDRRIGAITPPFGGLLPTKQ
jgi:hypothetical protein